MKHLYQLYPDAFVTGLSLCKATENHKKVVAVFIDMLKFRQINKKGVVKLSEICKNQANASVRRYKEKYGTEGNVLHIQEVFDRRADRTKGPERNREDAPPTALDYSSTIEVDLSEKFQNYASQWKNREFGRKKITTAYCTYLKREEHVASFNIWNET